MRAGIRPLAVPAAYVLLLGAALTVVLALRREDADPPDVAASPVPRLLAVHDLALDAGDGLPSWRSGRAEPAQPGSVLTVGGLMDGLGLHDVAVRLGPGLELRAATGRYRPGRLELDRVSLDGPDGRLLTTERAEIENGRVLFPGLCVFRPRTERERVERHLDLSLRELRERLR
jgi:hypothetical protein